jgi:hypothetical protein
MSFSLSNLCRARSALALLLIPTLTLPGYSQQAGDLKIKVIEGENAQHNIRRKAVSATLVEVRDLNNHLVPGARVQFELPALGPGGHFADGSRTLTVIADPQGRAAMSGFVPNDQQGQFRIVISASDAGRTASIGISQTNVLFSAPAGGQAAVPSKRSGPGTKLLLLLVIGAAAAAGGIAAAKGGGGGSSTTAASSTTPAPTTVSIGSISVGAPH